MRLLADRLLATDGNSDPHVARAQELLREPAQNHMPANIDQIGKCDRFVIPHATWDAMNGYKKSCDDASWDALMSAIRAPIPQCWFELQDSMTGCLLEGDNGVVFAAPGREFFAVATLHLDRIRGAHDGLAPNSEFVTWHPGGLPWKLTRADETLSVLIMWAVVIALTNSPRAAVARRKRLDNDAASRAMRMRRFQRGRPIFSYNQVDLIIPETCIYRGEVRAVESFEGMRGHMVIGHWRLIDKALEPFWVWIDGHERGDRDRGWIVKQRNVTYVAGGLRRGFAVPSGRGSSGERRKAIALGSEDASQTHSN